jgi:transposase-like protein
MRQEVIQKIENEDYTIAQVSRIFGIKYTTVRSILRTYKATGRVKKL